MEDHNHMDHSNHNMDNMDHSMVQKIIDHQMSVNDTSLLNNLSVSTNIIKNYSN